MSEYQKSKNKSNSMDDDTDFLRDRLEKGLPIPAGEYKFSGPIHFPKSKPNSIRREFRLWIISILMLWIVKLLPKDCIKTARWIMEQPWEK